MAEETKKKSPRIKSQIKRNRTNEKARQRNVSKRSRIATASKKVSVLVNKGDAEGAALALKEAIKLIDKSVTEGVYTRNTAARKKSSLAKLVNGLNK